MSSKLRNVKTKLKSWSKTRYGRWNKNMNTINEELLRTSERRAQIMSDDKLAARNIKYLLDLQESFWKKKNLMIKI